MTDLVAALVAAIDRARTARHADFVLIPDALLPITPTPTRTTPQLPLVARPQDCTCGANQLIGVAHWERCTSRAQAPIR